MKNRKGQGAKGYLLYLILGAVGLVVLGYTIGEAAERADIPSKIGLCRKSVELREGLKNTNNVAGKKLSKKSPLLCDTIELELPESKEADKNQVMQELVRRMVDSRYMFGDADIEDPFKQGELQLSIFSDQVNNCFISFILDVDEWDKYKEGDKITRSELTNYMETTTHSVKSNLGRLDGCVSTGGYCESNFECGARLGPFNLLENNRKCIGNLGCCATGDGCWDKGGRCSTSNPDPKAYVEYQDSDWDCQGGLDCYVPENNHFNYLDRLQEFEGESHIAVLTDIEPGQLYAVSYGAANIDECGDACDAVGYLGGLLAGGGTALFITKGVTAIGASASIGVIVIPVAIIGLGTGLALEYLSEEVVSVPIARFFNRDLPVVYLTTLDQVLEDDRCAIVSGQT